MVTAVVTCGVGRDPAPETPPWMQVGVCAATPPPPAAVVTAASLLAAGAPLREKVAREASPR